MKEQYLSNHVAEIFPLTAELFFLPGFLIPAKQPLYKISRNGNHILRCSNENSTYLAGRTLSITSNSSGFSDTSTLSDFWPLSKSTWNDKNSFRNQLIPELSTRTLCGPSTIITIFYLEINTGSWILFILTRENQPNICFWIN